jgi:hypothetical protein
MPTMKTVLLYVELLQGGSLELQGEKSGLFGVFLSMWPLRFRPLSQTPSYTWTLWRRPTL